jgi:uncharacterized SAM-binding protein YcdF (DUF218 family)
MVFLTGRCDKIAHAFSLAESQNPKKDCSSAEFIKNNSVRCFDNKTIQDVCIILGKQAKNSERNAKEINEWVKKNNIPEILLVASDYRMVRSIAELGRNDDRLNTYLSLVSSPANFMLFLEMLQRIP